KTTSITNGSLPKRRARSSTPSMVTRSQSFPKQARRMLMKLSPPPARHLIAVPGATSPRSSGDAFYSRWPISFVRTQQCWQTLKPSEETPTTTLELARLVQENIPDLPKGVLNVVTGEGPTAGRAIVESMQVDKVAFTGGTETGREVLKGVATSNLKKVSLELGG